MSRLPSAHEPAPADDQRLRLPLVLEREGAQSWLGVAAIGVVLGAVTLIIPALLPGDTAFGFLAILLGMIAGVYLGFALSDGRVRAFRAEYVGIVIHGALATIAIATSSAVVLAAGYLGHASWDAVHHPRAIDTVVPWWYVPLCIGYDVVVGVYVLLRFL